MRNREGGSEEESNDGGKDMKVLLAGATGTLGVPLVRALIAGGNDVIGLSRTPCKRDMLRALGAESLVADVMDQQALLKAVDGLEADAVIHQMTTLKKIPTRHRDMAATDALREVGTANLLAAARLLGARRFVTQSFFMGLRLRRLGRTGPHRGRSVRPSGAGCLRAAPRRDALD